MISKKMMTLYLYTMYAGLVVTYFCGVVPILASDKMRENGITDKIDINRQTAIIMIFFGFADAFGGYFFGKLTNSMGKKAGLAIIGLVGVSAVFLSYIAQYHASVLNNYRPASEHNGISLASHGVYATAQ